MTSPEIAVHPDADTLASEVAARLLAVLSEAQARGEVPHIALTGGTIADTLHREIARLAAEGPALDWSQVHIWWGDERFVAADDPERNAGQARAAWLDHVAVDPAKVHEMPAADGQDLDVAAAAYAEEVRAHGSGQFDVVMLGLGPDGHVASLFPHRPELDVTDAVTVAVRDSPKPPPERVSLTFEALNRAREVWFLVSGEGKSGAVAAALDGVDVHEIPARGVRGLALTRWDLDQDAAVRLRG